MNDTEKNISVRLNITVPYALRLQAAIHDLNISELTRGALRAEIAFLEEQRNEE